jgi:uncharacterized protein (TIGR03435 family)
VKGLVLVLVAAVMLFSGADRSANDSMKAFGQEAFATASITPTTSGTGEGVGVMRLQPGGGFTATNATLRELVAYAYQRHPFDRREVIGGPAWIDTDRFDVTAKAAAEHAIDADGGFRQTWAMLGRLLADRFTMKLHEEDRDRPVYALRLARRDGTLGPKLQKTDVDCGATMRSGGSPSQPGKGPPCSSKNPPGRLFANTASVPTIASLLSPHLDRIVIDRTGLTGRFNLELEASDIKAPPDYKPGPSDVGLPPARGRSIFVAVREQLGLSLQSETASVPVVMIDDAERPSPD